MFKEVVEKGFEVTGTFTNESEEINRDSTIELDKSRTGNSKIESRHTDIQILASLHGALPGNYFKKWEKQKNKGRFRY